jgi:hypothetical protein
MRYVERVEFTIDEYNMMIANLKSALKMKTQGMQFAFVESVLQVLEGRSELQKESQNGRIHPSA